MRVQGGKVHNRHDLLRETTAGEVPGAEQALFLAFLDLTKAFDLVSRNGLFQLLKKIGCPPKLHSIIDSFHTDMQSTVCFNGATSDPFPINSGVNQGCVLAPTLFGIFFSMLLFHAFKDNEDGIYLRTRSDGKLYYLARLRAKTNVRHVTIREVLFADDAAMATHTEEALQRLIDHFALPCDDFGLTISIKKTEVMEQGTTAQPSILRCSTQSNDSSTWGPPSAPISLSNQRLAPGSPRPRR